MASTTAVPGTVVYLVVGAMWYVMVLYYSRIGIEVAAIAETTVHRSSIVVWPKCCNEGTFWSVQSPSHSQKHFSLYF